MAQTKTKPRRGGAKSTPARSPSRSRAAPGSAAAKNAREPQGGVTGTVSAAASKAKTPLIAGGAALAGLAGGIVVARNGRQRKVLGVPVPHVAPGHGTKKALDGAAKAFGGAATEFGKAGSRVAELTAELRRIRERVES